MHSVGPARRKIIADLDAALHKFQAVQRFSMYRQRTNIGAPTHLPVEPPSSEALLATEEAYRDAELAERTSAIREIEPSIGVEDNARGTAHDLEMAAQRRRRARRTCLTLILGVVCVPLLRAPHPSFALDVIPTPRLSAHGSRSSSSAALPTRIHLIATQPPPPMPCIGMDPRARVPFTPEHAAAAEKLKEEREKSGAVTL
ncbi:hypothetical protein FB451DRAFT_1557484, partial [Mycena latifolia]